MPTQSSAWGGFLFIDRDSVLVNDDGTKDALDPDLIEALQAGFESGSGVADTRNPGRYSTADPGLRALFNELMPEIGIGSMDDLDNSTLEQLLEGIFD